ncbi:MAG: metal-dependent transcriptional regulator [Winkia neuii]|nr:metal-dependent transcriptional regulator [Winkia neuii]KWZ72968.1 iron dependent repressor, DNA binding domain protein [Winkia neuii]MDK8100227.1 metal-dependent transcriptional regulator [Winkia neuii]MDU3135405.1 metal-dependent transcriptional regulator [Winkia neuii]
MELSPMAEDYLKYIYSATEFEEARVGTNALAAAMNVAPSTASENVRRLVDSGLVEHERYRGIGLTEKGYSLAVQLVRKHRLLETFLVETLGYRWDEVDEEAEILEHAVTQRLLERIDKALGHPSRDPHGDPIPGADGTVEDTGWKRLTEFSAGQRVLVERVSDDDTQLLKEVLSQGLTPGLQVQVVERKPYAGTVTIRVEGTEKTVGDPVAAAVFCAPVS